MNFKLQLSLNRSMLQFSQILHTFVDIHIITDLIRFRFSKKELTHLWELTGETLTYYVWIKAEKQFASSVIFLMLSHIVYQTSKVQYEKICFHIH